MIWITDPSLIPKFASMASNGVRSSLAISMILERSSTLNGLVISDKDNYKLYYSVDEIIFNYFITLNGNVIKSTGYTGAHLGLYATSNGKETSDSASFDFVNYRVNKK